MHATLMWVHPQWLGKRLTALEQFLENQTRLIERAVDGLGMKVRETAYTRALSPGTAKTVQFTRLVQVT